MICFVFKIFFLLFWLGFFAFGFLFLFLFFLFFFIFFFNNISQKCFLTFISLTIQSKLFRPTIKFVVLLSTFVKHKTKFRFGLVTLTTSRRRSTLARVSSTNSSSAKTSRSRTPSTFHRASRRSTRSKTNI